MVKGDLLNDPNPPGPKFKKEILYWQVLKSWMISQTLIFNLFLIIIVCLSSRPDFAYSSFTDY
jgi:hypothetical protein